MSPYIEVKMLRAEIKRKQSEVDLLQSRLDALEEARYADYRAKRDRWAAEIHQSNVAPGS